MPTDTKDVEDTNCSSVMQFSTTETSNVEDTNCSSIMQYSIGDTWDIEDTNCSSIMQYSTGDTNYFEATNCSSIMQYSTGDTNGIISLSVLLLTYLIALFGFTGNLVSIHILQNRRIVSNFNRLLIMLSYFDAAYIFLFLIEQLPPLIETIKQRPEAASTIHSYLYPPLFVNNPKS